MKNEINAIKLKYNINFLASKKILLQTEIILKNCSYICLNKTFGKWKFFWNEMLYDIIINGFKMTFLYTIVTFTVTLYSYIHFFLYFSFFLFSFYLWIIQSFLFIRDLMAHDHKHDEDDSKVKKNSVRETVHGKKRQCNFVKINTRVRNQCTFIDKKKKIYTNVNEGNKIS